MIAPIENPSLLRHPWRVAALVAVVANISFNVLSSLGSDPTVADVSDKYPTWLTPAGYAFSIWGVIYGATLLYALWSLAPSQLQVRFHDRAAPWLLLMNALCSLWVAFFTVEQLGPSLLVVVAALIASVVLFSMVSDHLVSEHLSHYWRVPFALWLGWLSMATAANLCLMASAGGLTIGPIVASLLLLVCGSIAVAIATLFLDPVVPLVIGWATAAIAVAHFSESALVGIVASLVAVKSGMVGARLLAFSALPLPQIYRERVERMLRFVPPQRRLTRRAPQSFAGS